MAETFLDPVFVESQTGRSPLHGRKRQEHGYVQRAKRKFLPTAKLFQDFYLHAHVMPW
jgi:hypothetical protein